MENPISNVNQNYGDQPRWPSIRGYAIDRQHSMGLNRVRTKAISKEAGYSRTQRKHCNSQCVKESRDELSISHLSSIMRTLLGYITLTAGAANREAGLASLLPVLVRWPHGETPIIDSGDSAYSRHKASASAVPRLNDRYSDSIRLTRSSMPSISVSIALSSE